MTSNEYSILSVLIAEKKRHKLDRSVCHSAFCKANTFPKVYICALSVRTFFISAAGAKLTVCMYATERERFVSLGVEIISLP